MRDYRILKFTLRTSTGLAGANSEGVASSGCPVEQQHRPDRHPATTEEIGMVKGGQQTPV